MSSSLSAVLGIDPLQGILPHSERRRAISTLTQVEPKPPEIANWSRNFIQGFSLLPVTSYSFFSLPAVRLPRFLPSPPIPLLLQAVPVASNSLLNFPTVLMIKSFRKAKRLSDLSDKLKRSISRVTSTSSAYGLNAGGSGLHDTNNVEVLLQSPQKVIKALYTYEIQGPGELGFEKGDFFHVVAEEDNGWYLASNPMTHAKGMVPASYFEVFNRSRPITTENPAVTSPRRQHSAASASNMGYANGSPGRGNQRNSNQTLYATTLYDFKAERDGELDIAKDENLIICAHHAYEWFIAKPINRLGGPGLVPALFVKIRDLLNPNNSAPSENTVKVVETFHIPTVEEWKQQTARYQASTIPLGSISNQTPVVLSNTQFFQKDGDVSNRLSLSSLNASVLEASVDSYQLDNGRYQYLVIARLSNGKVRHLYRYYQDFYDLQVKLLELFPYEAGKIENLKRIIPSIPGPLINVNDSISKLRREKLDYYLRNLIALPAHISRCEEVLKLFDVLENGSDREFADKKDNRLLKPISRKSMYHHDRLSQYSNFHNTSGPTRVLSTPTSSDSLNRSMSSSSANLINSTSTSVPSDRPSKIKVKFYYEDDIFVLLLPTNLRLHDLKSKLYKRLSLENIATERPVDDIIRIYLKNDFDAMLEETGLALGLEQSAQMKLSTIEIATDDQFHHNMYDKCKLAILAII